MTTLRHRSMPPSNRLRREPRLSDDSPIRQRLNTDGMISYYDYPLGTDLDSTVGLVLSGTVTLKTLKGKIRRILYIKYYLGLFSKPYTPEDIDATAITGMHVPLTLKATRKSILLLEDKNYTLPLNTRDSKLKKMALIGLSSDMLNFGDYSGQFGQHPSVSSSTLRQGFISTLQAANYSMT
ncbi:glycoside hydrolase family 3 protein [Dothistroma septosporum NZE10]|uniref:beta-glucosidase n=1 Tax=Dothistroma septosporum (strain NZE10 / CBS 128990) TaxID=675120 RepID=N1PCL0_DOTSN|nr:glycoside hydrolase family 3 protein [Dothistroma septosporum NZE10]